MASSTFFIPSVNVIGADSLTDAMNMMADYGFTRTLIVTDNMLTKLGMAGDVQKALEERNIFSVIYDGTQPNPTTENVAAGLKLLKENNCDSVISGSDSNLLIVFYVQIMPDDLVMQLHRF